MSGLQVVTSHYKLDDSRKKDLCSNGIPHIIGSYDSHNVCYIPMNTIPPSYTLQYVFHDHVDLWLVESFLKRYPLSDGFHVMFSVDTKLFGLMILLFDVLVIQSLLLPCDFVHL